VFDVVPSHCGILLLASANTENPKPRPIRTTDGLRKILYPNHPRGTRRAGAQPEPETHNKSRAARNGTVVGNSGVRSEE
jgi:hypothetical protein